MSSTAACLFCRIAKREIPAEMVAETDTLFAIKDLKPQAPTHLLLIPKEHIPTLADTTEQHTPLLGQIVHLANRLARQFHLLPDGYRLVTNCGPNAGQSVWHLHVHLLGGRALQWPPG